MKIALVYRGFDAVHSQPRFSVELARYLAQRHDVHILSVAARTQRELAPACTFHDVPVSGVTVTGLYSARELLSFARNVRRLVVAGGYDVVHVRSPSTWVGDVLHLPGVMRGEAELQQLSRLRFGLSTARHPRSAARRLTEGRALANRGLRRIHVDAPRVRDDLERFCGIDPADVLVAVPGVDAAVFAPAVDRAAARQPFALAEDEFTLLFCGHDFERKGLDRAIEAVAAAASRPTLLVAGSNPDEPRYRELARRHGLDGRVRFLGARADVADVYRAADAFVLPTRADLWGATVVEAMATGIPPIVTRAAGAAEAVADGKTGIVLPEPFDLRSLRDAIDALAAPERRHAMGRAGVDAAATYSWAEHGRRVEEDLAAVAAGTVAPIRRRSPSLRRARARGVSGVA